jgi:hypothetical protein
MCGRICRASDNHTVMVTAFAKVSKDLLFDRNTGNHPKWDVILSGNKFIRIENLKWWEQKCRGKMIEVLLDVDQFSERNTVLRDSVRRAGRKLRGELPMVDFQIPKGYKILAKIHSQPLSKHWVLSILTVDSNTAAGSTNDPKLKELYTETGKVHHRSPVIIKHDKV